MEKPGPADIQPPRSKTPRRGRRDTSTERGLTEAREAHWRAPGHCSHLGGGNRATEPVCHLRPAGGPCPLQELGLLQKISGMEQEAPLGVARGEPCHFFKYSPPLEGSKEDEEAELALLDFDLEAPLELGPEVHHFLQSQLAAQRKKTGRGPPQNPQWKIMRVG